MPLLTWNQSLSQFAWSYKLWAIEILLIAIYLLGLNSYWGWNQLPAVGDAPEYENMAFHLWQGNGLSRGYTDSWSQLYESSDRSEYIKAMYSPNTEVGYTAYRPPFLPGVMSLTYQLFGRQFWAIRLLNCLAILFAVIIAMGLTRKFFGVIPSWITSIVLLLDPRFVEFSHRILTEAWAALVSCLIAVLLVKTLETKSTLWALLTGTLFGLAILIRTSFVLWTPLFLLLFFINFERDSNHPFNFKAANFKQLGINLFGILLVAGPWMIWNCQITQDFLPLGTHGWINLPVAYSEKIMQTGGIFSDEYAAKLKSRGPTLVNDWHELSLIEQEVVLTKQGKALSLNWMQQNLLKLPYLFLKKSFCCFIYDRSLFSLLAVPFLLGLFYTWHSPQTKLISGIIACQFLSVGLTWSTSGRFQMPVRPLIAVYIGLGIYLMLLLIFDKKFADRKLIENNSADPIS